MRWKKIIKFSARESAQPETMCAERAFFPGSRKLPNPNKSSSHTKVHISGNFIGMFTPLYFVNKIYIAVYDLQWVSFVPVSKKLL